LLDAIYQLECDEEVWLSRILEASRPEVDDGVGLMVYTFQASAEGITARKSVDDSRAPFTPILLEGVRTDPDLAMQVNTKFAVTTLSEIHGPARFSLHPIYREVFAPRGIHDVLGVVGLEPDGWGVGIVTGLRKMRALSPERRNFLERIAAHMQAAHRLRRRLGTSASESNPFPIAGSVATSDRQHVRWSVEYGQAKAPPDAEAQAVLDPAGQVLDAQGEARQPQSREVLRRAAVGVDRAKASMERNRRDTDPLGAWRALVDGRWSLLDQFDRDGRRFFIARRNEPGTPPVPLLDARERAVLGYRAAGHSIKLVAYEMGYTLSHTSRLVRSAMKKIGLRSPADLAAFVSALPKGDDADE
jgi:DNA-binding CsgD family transcriptional regulator